MTAKRKSAEPSAEYAGILRERGLKATPVRVELLSALAREKHPLSIKDIGLLVKGFNTTTLYRALETLTDAKLVNEVVIDSSKSMYETAIKRHHHHHVTCTSCGLIEDIDACAVISAHKKVHAPHFAEITGHTLEFFGVCAACAR